MVQGKTIGMILIGVGLVVALGAVLCLLPSLLEGQLRLSGFALGVVLSIIFITVPSIAAGVFMYVRGRTEAEQMAEAAKEKKLLNMVETQGKVRVADVAVELDVPLEKVRAYIYDLVGKGIFTGYINWDEGVLYAREASEMETTRCPHCGGERELVGKGVVKCPYCGSELFLQPAS
jgi:DNA-directed RNA polymerase subunit RPC12/RpoP